MALPSHRAVECTINYCFADMGNASSSNKISAQDRAILDMKNQRDKLRQYQKRISVVASREQEIARECLRKGDKRRALLALRRKKYQETLLSRTDQQLAQLEQLSSDVEFALVQQSVVLGLQQGNAVLKEINREMGGIEKVELILGESEEAQAYQREISEMLGTRMSNQEEDEVEDELEAMEREVLGTVPSLPNAPNGNLETLPDVPIETPEEKAKRRRKERLAQQQALNPLPA